jgi:predicted MPP superfamily phosphohydrolase
MLFHHLWYDDVRFSQGKGDLGGNMIFLIALLVLALLILAVMVKEAFANRVLHHELSFARFPASFDPLTIFFISDIHRRKISEKIISKAIGADMVIIGGDLTENKVPWKRVRNNIEKLSRIGPIYFIWGNNDYEVDTRQLKVLLLRHDATILANTAREMRLQNDEQIYLLGVDDLAKERDRLHDALSGVKRDSFKILVSHNPEIMEKILPEYRIDLVLSGHTHGGQIRIFNFGPYEKGGIKRKGNTVLFVSNGYGTTLLPLRLGAKAETHLITITHSHSNRSNF